MLGGAAACSPCWCCSTGCNVKSLWPYLVIGAVLWLFVLKSGIHATLAGVALALTIPLGGYGTESDEPERLAAAYAGALRSTLRSPISIVPIFGFANAGVSIAGMTP